MADILRIILDLVLAILIIVWLMADRKSALMLNNIKELIHVIFSQLNHIQMDQAELAVQLQQLKEQGEKSKAEITGKITDLENALANGGPVTQEVQDALAALKTTVQGIDDVVADAPAGEPPAQGSEEETV